jgi:hypothetical protein
MASGSDPCPEHHDRTRRRSLRYCFYIAHHGRGVSDDSQWAEELSEVEEFAIFDEADWLDLSDATGNLYGLRRSPDGTILDLGTRGEQISKFWETHEATPWHGFPLWPLAVDGPENRRRQPAPKAALEKMERIGLLLPKQRRRLQKGKHT